MEQGQFIELLSDLVKIGEAQDNRLTKDEISRYFADLYLAEEQMELLYQYLAANKILVEGAVMPARQEEKEGPAARLEPEEERYLEQYLEDLALIEPISEAESNALTEAMAAGNEAAKQRVIESGLRRICDLANEYAGRGVHIGDLIQEGNMALLKAADRFTKGDFWLFSLPLAREAMLEAIEEQSGQAAIGEKIAVRANRLMDISAELAKELEREPTAAELANRLHMTEEEVRDIMKISLDVISVADSGLGAGEEEGHHHHHHEDGCGCGHEHE
jgi:RNA polymerase primary sigma factor